MVGLLYPLSVTIIFLSATWICLAEAANLLDHMYLFCAVTFVLIFLPCNACYSVDSLIWPSIRRDRVPKLILFFLRALFIVIYAYVGLSKINPDWLRGEPLRHWFAKRAKCVDSLIQSLVY
jgi:hypothetical protein